MDITVFIPARLESSRLKKKALKLISGIPAIVHTYIRSTFAKNISDVYVCTDSNLIARAVKKVNGKVIMTKKHINGTERVSEAAAKTNSKNLIMINGDEVLINPNHIELMSECLAKNHDKIKFFQGHTVYNELNDKASFKSVLNKKNQIIFSSREDIPSSCISGIESLKKTVFITGFATNAITEYVNWGECDLERIEPNEFHRILFHDEKIQSIEMQNAQISLDTQKDLELIKKLFLKDKLYERYKHYKEMF